MKKEKILILLGIVFISITVVMVTDAQPIQYVRFNENKRFLGLDYKIDGIWTSQLLAEITPLNKSAFRITWYLHNSSQPAKIIEYFQPRANYYSLDIESFYCYNETNTKAVFLVTWFKGTNYLGTQRDYGSFKVRDKDNHVRSIDDIQRIRKIEYSLGDYE